MSYEYLCLGSVREFKLVYRVYVRMSDASVVIEKEKHASIACFMCTYSFILQWSHEE